MIVRDEENNLPHCLESVRGLFDEIVIVDTGSIDRTKEIAREFGAKVFDFAWIDDFAAARNEVLSHATGDYAFWLDADDVVEPGQREKLVALLAGLTRPSKTDDHLVNSNNTCSSNHSSPSPLRGEGWGEGEASRPDPTTAPLTRPVTGSTPPAINACGSAGSTPPNPPFARGEKDRLARPVARRKVTAKPLMSCSCACDPSPDGTGGDTVVDHIRLFPVREDVRWTYRVHEQILPSLRRAKISVRWTDLTVRHTGYVDKALRARKLERDIAILKASWKTGRATLSFFSTWGQSPSSGPRGPRRSVSRAQPGRLGTADSIVRKLFALIARTHQMMGDSQGRCEPVPEGLKLDPEDAELWFRKAVVHRHRGESSEAERCWRLILNLRRPTSFAVSTRGFTAI